MITTPTELANIPDEMRGAPRAPIPLAHTSYW
jgi:hypothetical protein